MYLLWGRFLHQTEKQYTSKFRWIKIRLSMLCETYAVSCMSKVQGKYKIYLKYYHICTKCFLMHTEIDAEVVKSQVWALKNLPSECKRNSMNIRNWRMYLNVHTEIPWSLKTDWQVVSCRSEESRVNWWLFHYFWTKKDTRTPANPLFWSGIWFNFRI